MSQRKPHSIPIAVVGVSALFPGSTTEGGFWRDILAGRDLITDVPPGHWLIEDYYDPDPSAPDKTYAKRGAFLSPSAFNPLEFGVPPSIVPATDSAQLLALIVAQRVLNDASDGQFASMNRDGISVILGVTSAQELLGSMVSRLQRPIWAKALRDAGLPESKVEEVCKRIADEYVPWQESTFPGLLGNVVAGRIANRLDLGGTNCVTDAACASAFSAVSMGVNELYLGQSDLVIAGGVDTMNDIFMYMCFSKTPALSPTGDCRPFSDRADGTMLGEGLGMVALKRLEDAERDNDRIYAVMHGVGASSDGRAKSVYAPRPEGQAKALRRAYATAGYGPETVELAEAHGTGTKAGDAAEFAGLKLAFDESGHQPRQWCALGSVKSQIGHTKAAAGAAGLFKAIMALHHKVLPPTIKVDQPNPQLALETSPFYLNTETRPWVRNSDHPRRASVSSFGFGGSNFHIALEEYIGSSKKAYRKRAAANELVVFADATPTALVDRLRGVQVGGERFLPWLARTSQHDLGDGPARVAILAKDDADLAAKLTKAAEMIAKAPNESFSSPTGIHYGNGETAGGIALLFSGQGSQYLGMGGDLAMSSPAAMAVWDRAADIDMGETERLHDVVFPRPVFNEHDRESQRQRLVQTRWAQPAIGAASLSQLAVLRNLGITPNAVGGHSFGEVTALHAAGVIDHDAVLLIARKRGELMGEAAALTPGAMTAVVADIAAVRVAITKSNADVVVANHNSPNQVVVSGRVEEIEKLEKHLHDSGARFRRLPVATAFHSPVVAGSSEPFAEVLEGFEFGKPTIPVYANSEAAPYPSEAKEMRRILAEQIARPVRFVEQIEAMYAAGIRTFIEVGPNAVLTGLVGKILDRRPHSAINLDREGKPGLASLHEAIGRLAVSGVSVNFETLWAEFAPSGDPRLVKKPAMALDIDGTNYGKPYPPVGGASALPPPNPEREPEVIVREVIREVPVAAVGYTSAIPGVAAQIRPAIPNLPKNLPRPLANAYQSWMQAYQEAQRQTAEVHTAWQQSMSETHIAFLKTAERSLEGLTSMVGSTPMQAGAVLSLAATVAAHSPMAPPPLPNQHPIPMIESMMTSLPSGASIAEHRDPRTVASGAAAVAAAPSLDLEALLLEVVSDKTGYPADMLTMEMGLEADLGIDSIKRVEILAAMREKAPSLPEVDTAVMASLRGLGDIVEHMRAALGQIATAPSAPAVAVMAAMAMTAAPVAPAAIGTDLQRLLLDVVSDKTGYPADMLTMEMGLEADLGIDSIKRVEILAAMREREPHLPEVDTAVMASLHSLGDIVEHMRASLGAGPALAGATMPDATAAVAIAAPIQPVATDLRQLLLSVVAEKTGYPADMLTMEMGLEADLGIDSIKRVEILAAMREREPGLPEVDTAVMASLRSLGDIVEHMRANSSAAATIETVAAVAAAPASAVTATAAPTDLKLLLLEVVADKTGYPAGMLTMEMGLEADLGVDSIKRVEILAAMRQRASDLPEVDTAAMAGLRTLGDIVTHMVKHAAAANIAKAAKPATLAPRSLARLGRFTLAEADAPATGVPMAGLAKTDFVAITGDNGGIGQALVGALAARGVSARVVADVPAEATSAIFLGGLAEVGTVDHAVGINRAAFRTAKAIAARLAANPGAFVVVQDTDGDFGLRGSERAWLGGLAGLAKTAAQEWPQASVKAIDLERAGRDAKTLAEALAAELFAGGPELEVGLHADGRRTTLASARTEVEGGTPSINQESVVIATGGGRGVTATTLIELARRAQPRLALLGRTLLTDEPAAVAGIADDAGLKRALLAAARTSGKSATPKEIGAAVARIQASREIRATLAAIQAAGSEVRYVPVDVQDSAALGYALDDVRNEWGPVTGIVHGAGVLADKLITDKTEEQFDFVFETKVTGLRNLLAATADDPVSMICLFSSVAARSGNSGQCDYAMANEVLNKVANLEARRRGDACLVKSLNWGPWEGGMVTPALKAQFEAMGVPLIPLADGARMMADELLGSDRGQVELVLGSAPRQGALLSHATSSDTFEVLVDQASYPFLADHSIKDVPVVPVVLVLEWFTRAAKAMHPELELAACRNLKVRSGIRLTHYTNGGERFDVRRKLATTTAAGVTLEIELRGADDTLHYTASLDLAPRAPEPRQTQQPNLNLKDWTAKIYGDTLFHGPNFQVIRSLDGVSKLGISAVLAGTQEIGWNGGVPWQTDVAAMDGGLQLALLWTRHVLGGRSLPTAVNEYHDYGQKLTDRPIRCVLQGEVVGSAKTVSNITFTNHEGTLLAEMRGVETHLLPS